ncbi:phosphomannomutase [Shewanella kaireitica]|uniref:phosphomannomutase n=1 Tax=Shewanella kaireitica TaxID=212021 RepID=UPI0024B2811F|nr:phosphomannomutase [Shewanella kaireitica]
MLLSKDILASSGVKFGTSGARGLVTQFSNDVCAAFVHAFITGIQSQFTFDSVAIAIDNRPSSPSMAMACVAAIKQLGLAPVYYGVIPTPALAYRAMQDDIPCIMVTGSHIPFDRNGLKFYRPDGEITKADEVAIVESPAVFEPITELPVLEANEYAKQSYVERYASLFDANLLTGKKIGIYEHSSAGRDLYADLFQSLGAEVVALERSNEFVPIDTEAVSTKDVAKAKAWSKQYGFDAIFSTDGDGDRPLVADEHGNWLRGDILGLLCANVLNIDALAVPVSCNTAIEKSAVFKQVTRTKIGSPYVIAEFEKLNTQFDGVAGFEANGGFLLGSDVQVAGSTLKALPTRDALLPFFMLLSAAKNSTITQLVDKLPKRFTHSDRIENFATETSQKIIAEAAEQPQVLLTKLSITESIVSMDVTDGLRITLSNDDVVHLRPSGNAPELRCYAESSSIEVAQQLVTQVLINIIK